MKEETVQKLLNKVKADYNAYARKFSRTRPGLKGDVLELVEKYIKDGHKVLDVGCGNGRLLRALAGKDVQYFGIDNSVKLIEEAKRKFPSDPSTLPVRPRAHGREVGAGKWPATNDSFQMADVLDLPFGDNEFDTVTCIAVLHHIPSQELQLKALQETYRVLKPGGKLIMMNWNLSREVWNLKRIVILLYCYTVGGRGCLDFRDLFIPWGITGSKEKRYYHAFILSELERLVKKAGFKLCERYYTDKRKKSSFWRSYWKRGNLVVAAVKK